MMKIAVVCANGKAGKLIVKEAVDRGLDVNPEHTACVADGPDFPDAFKPLAAAMAKALGELRLEMGSRLGLRDPQKFSCLWVIDFPLFEWNEDDQRFYAMHHPFTMPMEEDLPYLDSDPGRVRAKAYDIVLNGNEIGGGSVRIFNQEIQSKMFEVLGFTPEQAEEQFGFLLNAFKYGVPPHAGLAYGLDRLVMLMAKEDSIRDVIAFPKVKDASCLMTEAPSPVDAAQLEELGLEVEPQAEEETTEE